MAMNIFNSIDFWIYYLQTHYFDWISEEVIAKLH